jgi:putative transcriptional regulator
MLTGFENLSRFQSIPPEKIALTGKLLLASPFMNDSMFAGSVILISAHSKDAGALGFIINQPTSEVLSDNYSKWLSNTSVSSKIFKGGPVEHDVIMGLGHSTDQLSTSQGLYQLEHNLVVLDLEAASTDDTKDMHQLRLFKGYSGWTPGQLEAEIQAEGWLIAESNIMDPFSLRPENLYEKVIRRQLGGLTEYYPTETLSLN